MALRDQPPLPFEEPHPPPRPTERLLSAQDLADYLEIPVKTIYTWRHRNTGPRGFRIGKHLRYRWGDIETWLADRLGEEA